MIVSFSPETCDSHRKTIFHVTRFLLLLVGNSFAGFWAGELLASCAVDEERNQTNCFALPIHLSLLDAILRAERRN
jgi:hypothetical protein